MRSARRKTSERQLSPIALAVIRDIAEAIAIRDHEEEMRTASKAAGRRRGARGEAGTPVIADAMTSTQRD